MNGPRGLSRFTPPRKTQKPRPPKEFSQAKKTVYVGGPGEPPAWFMKTGIVSRSEWFIYWALRKVKGPPGDFSWANQVPAGGGRGQRGGAIIDFVIWDQEPRLAIRIQTDRFHIASPTSIHSYDEASKRMLERVGYKVIDIYEQHFLSDKSGKAAIAIVREALKGQQRPNPITLPNAKVRAS